MKKLIRLACLVGMLLLSGCQTVTTLGQAVANAEPPASPPTVILVCRSALCQHGNPPASAPINSSGYYEVLPQQPFTYIQALHTELLTFSILVNGTAVPHVISGRFDQCIPQGCVFLNSQLYVDANQQPKLDSNGNRQTMEHAVLVLPAAQSEVESLTVTLQTASSNPQYTGTPQQTATTNLMLGSIPPLKPVLAAQPIPIPGGYGMAYSIYDPGPGNLHAPPVDSFTLYAVSTRNPFSTQTILQSYQYRGEFQWKDTTNNYAGSAATTQTFLVTTANNSGSSEVSDPIVVSIPKAPASGPGQKQTPLTCSGAAATNTYGNYSVTGETANKCSVTINETANSQSEAQSCAQQQDPGVTIGTLNWAYLAVYSPDGNGGYYCSTTQLQQVNSGDAEQCANSQSQGQTIKDITSQILSNGSVNSTALNDYCTAHPSP